MGGASLGVLYGSYNLMVLSAEAVRSFCSLLTKAIDFTTFSAAVVFQTSSRLPRSQTLTTLWRVSFSVKGDQNLTSHPSPEPLANRWRLFGSLAVHTY